MSKIAHLVKLSRNRNLSKLDILIWLGFNILIFFESKFLKSFKLDDFEKIKTISISKIKKIDSSSLNFGIELISTSSLLKSGIFTKIEDQLIKSLKSLKVKSTLSNMPESTFNICHQFFYRTALPIKNKVTTTLVTHVDYRTKLLYLKWLIKRNVIPIFMSNHTASFVKKVMGESFKFYVCPLPPQTEGIYRKVKVGFITKIYTDGRKNEFLIIDTLKSIKNRDKLEFYIMGENTKKLSIKISRLGIEVHNINFFDQKNYWNYLKSIDYLIYTGIDEIAISVVDALYCGVPAIVPKVKFYNNINSKGLIFFKSTDDLIKILQKIITSKVNISEHISPKDNNQYALNLIQIWNDILKGKL